MQFVEQQERPKRTESSRLRRCRRGASTVEFALTAPLLFLFFLVSVELGRVYMMRQTLENAVYEAARSGLVPATTDAEIRDSAMAVLNVVNIKNPDIRISQDSQRVAISISLDIKDSSWLPPFFFANKSLSTALTLEKD